MLIDYIKDVRHAEEEIFDAIKASPAPVVLFGAGESAWYNLTYLHYHGIEPVCICDNNPAKHGAHHLGLPVCSYDHFRNKIAAGKNKYHIIASVGTQYKDAIFSQLAAAHEKNPVWYLRGYEICGKKITRQYILDHIAQFEEAHSSLADKISKKVFVNVLNAKISGDYSLYEEIMTPTMYFDKDVVTLTENEVLLDVGAYKGNGIVEFVKITGAKYDAIIAFEPDKKTFATLKNTVAKNGIKKVEPYNIGAWHKHASLCFHHGQEASSRLLETAAAIFPNAAIEVDAIDNILCGRRITYVSIDVEGAERNAILGAEKTIKQWKPKMAVCVYHRREDLFDILLLLKSFMPKYKFYMRHYTNNQTETVLYAL